jgi:hypothetical protein
MYTSTIVLLYYWHTHTNKANIITTSNPCSITRDMIPFLTRMYTQCRDLFAFRVCWVSLSLSPPPPLLLMFGYYSLLSILPYVFFWVMMKVWDRLFFWNSTEVILYITRHSVHCTLGWHLLDRENNSNFYFSFRLFLNLGGKFEKAS